MSFGLCPSTSSPSGSVPEVEERYSLVVALFCILIMLVQRMDKDSSNGEVHSLSKCSRSGHNREQSGAKVVFNSTAHCLGQSTVVYADAVAQGSD